MNTASARPPATCGNICSRWASTRQGRPLASAAASHAPAGGTGRSFARLLALLAALLLAACSPGGLVYNAPIAQTYERLCRLDLGDNVRSVVFRYDAETLPYTSLPNESVSWRMQNGIIVVAHLSEAGENSTRVDVDVTLPPDVQARIPARFHAMMKDMVRERIASYLEDRPFNDDKFVDQMLAGTNLMP